MSTEVLIYLQLDLLNGESKIGKVVDYLHGQGRVISISTIYKRYRSDVQTDLSANIELVIRHASEITVDQYVERLKHIRVINQSVDSKAKLNIELLNYGAMVSMTPLLTLPSPLLLTDEVVRKCAAEVWGDYQHPIMRKTLAEMAAEVRLESNTEFFRQGTSYPGL